MKARVQYNDFEGTSAADISDALSQYSGDTLESIADYFELNKSRFKIIGISIYGTEEFMISLICVDKEESNEEKKHIVSMAVEMDDENPLSILFKRLNIVIHNKYDSEDINLEIDREVNFEDYH